MALKVLKNERVIMVDIDDTLVMHGQANVYGAYTVYVKDPLGGTNIAMRVNEPMVRLVEEEIARGSQVCYWSRGGYQWAKNVVEALGLHLQLGIQIVLTKPFAYFDDSDVSLWMKDRVYLNPDVPYKK